MPYEIRYALKPEACERLGLSKELAEFVKKQHPKATNLNAILTFKQEDKKEPVGPKVGTGLIALSLHILESMKYNNQLYVHLQDM